MAAAVAALPSPLPPPPPHVATRIALATLRLEFNDMTTTARASSPTALTRGAGPPLRALCLGGNHVGAVGATAAGALLAPRFTLLDLCHNDLGADGCAALATALGTLLAADMASLLGRGRGEHLQGGALPIMPSDCDEADGSTLRTLNVSRNGVLDAGGEALADALR